MKTPPRPYSKHELLNLRNVGPAVLRDLEILGISTIAQLRSETADHLYEELHRRTGIVHDPCMWDVFAAIIHEAKTGDKTAWWSWTPMRKSRKGNLL